MRSDTNMGDAVPQPNTGGPAARRVVLAASPRRALPDVSGFQHVLVPNARAARALGLTGPVHSIERIAGKHLLSGAAAAPLALASELKERRLLRQAVRDVLRPEDLEGTVRYYGATVREILRAGYGLPLAAGSGAGPALFRRGGR